MSVIDAVADRRSWGRTFESAIGAYLVSQAFVHRFEVFYWRERNDEVDFVLRQRNRVVSEISSGLQGAFNGGYVTLR